jgi:hypothetical protein
LRLIVSSAFRLSFSHFTLLRKNATQKIKLKKIQVEPSTLQSWFHYDELDSSPRPPPRQPTWASSSANSIPPASLPHPFRRLETKTLFGRRMIERRSDLKSSAPSSRPLTPNCRSLLPRASNLRCRLPLSPVSCSQGRANGLETAHRGSRFDLAHSSARLLKKELAW